MFQALRTIVGQPLELPMNALLRQNENFLSYQQFMAFKLLAATAANLKASGHSEVNELPAAMRNVSQVPDPGIRQVESLYGDAGLWRLQFLCWKSNEVDFKHFYDVIKDDPAIRKLAQVLHGPARQNLTYDNHLLRPVAQLDQYAHNLIQPSLSRKLYNPGVQQGFLVYGLGGPRILVSHPFRGAKQGLYDVYMNSLDVTTSLMQRGFYGSFLFLDYIAGLNFDVAEVPAWVLWFSKIAANSDLIVYVKEEGSDFQSSQQLEIDFSPDRVPKKIVNFPPGELRWAKKYEHERIPERVMHIIPGRGVVSEEEWDADDAKMARALVSGYKRKNLPEDRLFVLNEDGRFESLPHP